MVNEHAKELSQSAGDRDREQPKPATIGDRIAQTGNPGGFTLSPDLTEICPKLKDHSMAPHKGIIALMGSGELTSTMVEVHKELLSRVPAPARAVFLDTPAGFQLNADHLSNKAVEYFRRHIHQNMAIASYKSKETCSPFEEEQAFRTLRQSNFILIGPGSPSYAVRHWHQTPVPEILTKCIESGGCLVAASAAALTVGRFTLPVYEIYKVGQDLHWVDGLDILGHFGFNLAVIPHWNNAEGGTHDTRFCYMGYPRFLKLESLFPQHVSVLGLDEHTACLLDLETEEAIVRGIGQVTLRRNETEIAFSKGERFPLDLLRGGTTEREWNASSQASPSELPSRAEGETFWKSLHSIEESFYTGIKKHDSQSAANALLELDRTIWEAQHALESDEFIAQAREIMREMIVLLGIEIDRFPKDETASLAPLAEEMMKLREGFRREKKWQEADAIRESLQRVGIVLEDTREGPRWHLEE